MAEKGKEKVENDPAKTEKNEAKIEAGVERKVASTPNPSEAVNIIGDIKKPDPNDKDDVLEYFKKIDSKLDQLINPKKEAKKEEGHTPTPDLKEPDTMPKREEKIRWYDRPLI